jgi:hypothetical protein
MSEIHFHDGKKVLDEVTTWHKYLRDHIRLSDKITPLVLDLLVSQLFVADPAERATAIKLCERLDEIVKMVQATTHTGLPDFISQLWQETDKQAAAKKLHKSLEKLLEKLFKLHLAGITDCRAPLSCLAKGLQSMARLCRWQRPLQSPEIWMK